LVTFWVCSLYPYRWTTGGTYMDFCDRIMTEDVANCKRYIEMKEREDV